MNKRLVVVIVAVTRNPLSKFSMIAFRTNATLLAGGYLFISARCLNIPCIPRRDRSELQKKIYNE
jgi:hypothetical protein